MIVTIGRQPVADNREISELLNGKVGESIPIEFVPAGLSVKDPKNRKKVDLQAVGRDVTAGLVYDAGPLKTPHASPSYRVVGMATSTFRI